MITKLPSFTMQYRSVADLNADIVAWMPSLPRDLDLIVGIPRSGLFAANLLALHLNLPLADLDGYIANRTLGGGERFSARLKSNQNRKPKVLIVDDSYASGAAMKKARQQLRDANLDAELFFAAVYTAPGTGGEVDFCAAEIAQPRAFEWNIMHHRNLIPNCCMDIDGVLCRDPSNAENDDGERYLRFLAEVPARFIPTYTVPYLVTSRLEKYRQPTEAWLAKNKIPYRELRMLDLPSAAERRRLGSHASFKASVYQQTDTIMFYESSADQAPVIANLSGKFAFCTDTRQMLQPGTLNRSRQLAVTFSRRALRRARALFAHA